MADCSKLTSFISRIENTDSFGEWEHHENDDGVFSLPTVRYSQVVYDFCDAIIPFYDHDYLSNLKNKYGLEANGPIYSYDISDADEDCILTFLTAVVRKDRFCEGALLHAFEEGHILRWLKRLEELSS